MRALNQAGDQGGPYSTTRIYYSGAINMYKNIFIIPEIPVRDWLRSYYAGSSVPCVSDAGFTVDGICHYRRVRTSASVLY